MAFQTEYQHQVQTLRPAPPSKPYGLIQPSVDSSANLQEATQNVTFSCESHALFNLHNVKMYAAFIH